MRCSTCVCYDCDLLDLTLSACLNSCTSCFNSRMASKMCSSVIAPSGRYASRKETTGFNDAYLDSSMSREPFRE